MAFSVGKELKMVRKFFEIILCIGKVRSYTFCRL